MLLCLFLTCCWLFASDTQPDVSAHDNIVFLGDFYNTKYTNATGQFFFYKRIGFCIAYPKYASLLFNFFVVNTVPSLG